MSRVFLIVLDSFGIGAMPDSESFGDVNVNTIGSCSTHDAFNLPNLSKMGLFNIDEVTTAKDYKVDNPTALIARMTEKSMGKDTTIGHWEIAGVVSPKPLPTFPNGFPEEFIKEFEQRVGRKCLCNKTYSGTEVIKDYGDEHVKTGNLIVYTSADSVFQIAAHEDVVPLETLYEYCHIARQMLQGEELGVGRVIARPFIGENGNYTRTSNRHDYSLLPPKDTMLDVIKNAGMDTLAVGKINDIFAGKGITEFVYTKSNDDGVEKMLNMMDRDFNGICFVNLVDFDMVYGHRRNIEGYATALAKFDSQLPSIFDKMRDDDYLMITADHGCDPGYLATTDHTREYTPFIVYGKKVNPANKGTRSTFADIAATVTKILGIDENFGAESLI